MFSVRSASRRFALQTFVVSALLATQLVSATKALAAVEIKYSAGMTAAQKNLLTQDLERLQHVRFSDPTGEVQRIMKLPDLSTASLENWLQTRARYIIDEKHPINQFTVFALSPMTYPASPAQPTVPVEQKENKVPGVDGVLQVTSQEDTGGGGTPATQSPGTTTPKAEPTPAEKPAEDSGPMIVMGNMGAALYMIGRANNVLVGFNMLGEGLIPVNSPRVGLFQVGRGLFVPLSPRWAPEVVENFVHSMFRLDTLFHEARHSDGNTRTASNQLGFAHEICPAGSDFAGFPACDRPSNGPYRVGSLIMKAAIEGCGADCETRDIEIMTLLYADSMSRILTPTAVVAASNTDSALCERLQKARPNIPFCQKQSGEALFAALEWDDAPEGVEIPTRKPASTVEVPTVQTPSPGDMTFGEE